MKFQRGLTLSGLLFWGIVLGLGSLLVMKVTPSVIEYYKVLKDSKSAVAQVAPGATVADVKQAFSKYAEIDNIDFPADQLDISKQGNQVVISFNYERRIPLFLNASLVLNFRGSTAN